MIDAADAFIDIHEVERRTRDLSLDAEHLRHILHEQRLARAEVSIEADNRPLMQFLAHHLRKLCRFCRRPRDSRKHFGSIHS